MAQPETAPLLHPCWAELSTPDPEAAQAYHQRLFGWSALTDPATGHTRFQFGGLDVAGCRAHPPEATAQGIPPHWLAYVKVADVAVTAARVPELGGALIAPPFEVGGLGRMAILRDPEGGVLALWEDGTYGGAALRGAPGALCWIELMARDAARARAFYTGLLGWETKVSRDFGFEYTEFLAAGAPVGGLMAMEGPEWEGIPPHWMVYFAVADVEATVAQATAAGGRVCVPPTDVPGVGRFSVLDDPTGATCSVIQLNPM